jgi:hypothetical protein
MRDLKCLRATCVVACSALLAGTVLYDPARAHDRIAQGQTVYRAAKEDTNVLRRPSTGSVSEGASKTGGAEVPDGSSSPSTPMAVVAPAPKHSDDCVLELSDSGRPRQEAASADAKEPLGGSGASQNADDNQSSANTRQYYMIENGFEDW